MTTETHDANLDLVITRVVALPRETIWKAWTQPNHLMKWFTPAPWQTVACEIDLRPGGRFHTVMRGPEGQEFPLDGCYLEILENRRLVWTDALRPGYRPAAEPFFTAVLTLDDHPDGTLYTARAMHKNEADRERHEEMGFEFGWNAALDQLIDIAHTIA